jgi:hypothetical protein
MNRIFGYFSKNFFILLGVFTILPLFVLSFFNHPTSDDFSFTNLAIQNGFWKAQIIKYNIWTGRFFSTALATGLNPLVYDWMFGYKLIPVATILLLLHSFYVFMKELTASTLSRQMTLTLMLAFFFLFIYQMPGLNRGIYWMMGIYIYQMANIASLYFFALMLRAYRTPNSRRKIFLAIASSLWLVAAIGTNEATMATLDVFLGLIFLYKFYKSREVDKFLVFVLVIAVIASCAVVFAPGNVVRASSLTMKNDLDQQSIFSVFTITALGSLRLIGGWLASPVLLFTILFIPLATKLSAHLKEKMSYFTIHPAISLSILLLLVFVNLFPAVWARGSIPPPRTLNVTFLIFLAGWFFNIQVIVHFFHKIGYQFKKLPGYAYAITGFLVCWAILLQENNLRLAGSNLLNKEMIKGILTFNLQESDLQGTAYAYDKEMQRRYQMLRQCQDDICEVDRLKSRPYAIFVRDIEEDEKDRKNVFTAIYFKKKALRLKREIQTSQK